MAKKKNCHNVRRSRGGKRNSGIARFSDGGVKRLSTGKKRKKSKRKGNSIVVTSPSSPIRQDSVNKLMAETTLLTPMNTFVNDEPLPARSQSKKKKRKNNFMVASSPSTSRKSVSDHELMPATSQSTAEISVANDEPIPITDVSALEKSGVDDESILTTKKKRKNSFMVASSPSSSRKSVSDHELMPATSQSTAEISVFNDEPIPITGVSALEKSDVDDESILTTKKKRKNNSTEVTSPSTSNKTVSGDETSQSTAEKSVNNDESILLISHLVPKISVIDDKPIPAATQSVPEKTLVIDETMPATSEKSVVNNETIDLAASDDENMETLNDTPNTSTKKKVRKAQLKNNSIVIDITETSIVNDDIIIDHISPAKKRNRRMLEIENNNLVTDVNKDEDEKDDIIILHSNCKIVEEIQVIKHNRPKSKVLSFCKGIDLIKEPMTQPLPSLVLNTPIGGCNNSGRNYFNAPVCNPYNKRKRKSGNNIENEIKKKFQKNPKLLLDSLPPKEKLSAIGRNVYSENPVIIPTFGLRPVIIDGSNVAFHHSRNRQFSCKGLEICINYFKEKGHKVTAFVPQFRVKGNKCDNPKLLEKLVNQGDVILTPSRIVDGKAINSYDDRYIVQFAAAKGGVIVTRDNYADLLKENPAWEETIKYRLLQFTWADDLLMFPNDPLGCRGPNLDRFLSFS